MAAAAHRIRATDTEKEAVRRLLAGEMPYVQGDRPRRVKGVERDVSVGIRRVQTAAANLRSEWRKATGVELARRHEREGGAEGTQWKKVAMGVWQQSTRAIAMEGTDAHEHRNGWTVATALVQYALRRRQAHRATDTSQQREREGEKGVVVFDIETTHLIDEATAFHEMETSVACTITLHAARESKATWEGAKRHTYWHETARTAEVRDTQIPSAQLMAHLKKRTVRCVRCWTNSTEQA